MVVYNFIKQDRVVVETYWNLLSLKNENCFKKSIILFAVKNFHGKLSENFSAFMTFNR